MLLDDEKHIIAAPLRADFGTRLGAYLINGVFMIITVFLCTWLVAFISTMLWAESIEASAAQNAPDTSIRGITGFLAIIIFGRKNC